MNESITVQANPFVITIHPEADGGPEHFMCLLVDYCVVLKKNGAAVAEGIVADVRDDQFTLRNWDADSDEYMKPIGTFHMFNGDFDEVEYQ